MSSITLLLSWFDELVDIIDTEEQTEEGGEGEAGAVTPETSMATQDRKKGR